MTDKIKPLGDNVLVKMRKQERKTKSGIVLPDTADDEKPQIGEVMAVGDDSKKIRVKAGDKIIFAKYSGTEIKIDNEEYLILKSEDILAIVE
jgi:chaperonin GroES